MNDDFLNHDQLRYVRGKQSARERLENKLTQSGEVWVAGATVAISAGAAAYSASQSSGGGGAPVAPKFHKATYTPLDTNSLQTTSVDTANDLTKQYDQQYYAASDADYAQRHPNLVAANKLAESNALSAEQGNLPPGLEAQLTRAGLSDGSAALSNSTIPGSSGSFGVARGLGVGYLDYLNNANQNLANLDAANPERGFGLTGTQALSQQEQNQSLYNSAIVGNNQGLNSVAVSNSTGQNSSDQAGFAGALQAFTAQQAANRAAVNTLATGATQALGQYAAYNRTPTYTATPNFSGIYGIG